MNGVPRPTRDARAGDRPSATWLNEPARQLRSVHVDTRQGRHERWSDLLEALPHVMVAAKITRVEAPFIDGLNPFPSQVFYWAQEVGNADSKVDRERPFYGQDVHGDEARVWPAQVGMDCFIVRGIDQEGQAYGRLMLLPGSEVVARRRCTGGGGVPPPPPPPPPNGLPPIFSPFRPPRNTDPASNPVEPVYEI